MELAELAATEPDPKKLLALVQEINALLAPKQPPDKKPSAQSAPAS
jgi:hypothetical protein